MCLSKCLISLEMEDAERLWRGTSRKQIKLQIRGGQKGQESDDGGITSIKVHRPKGTQVPQVDGCCFFKTTDM